MARVIKWCRSPKRTTMTDEELEHQDKQEQKEEHKEETKKTLKTVITSVMCTLLFVLILLLITILCLKNCSPRTNNGDISGSSSEPTWTEHDNTSLDNVFKTIVNHQIIDYGFDDDAVSTVIAVSCTDSASAFTLDITAYSESKVYYYKITNYSYAGSNNFVDFLLSYNFDINFVLDGAVTLSLLEKDSNQTITTTETNEKHIIAKSATDKYLSGYYVDENNRFHAYQKLAVADGNNPYATAADSVVDYNNNLYGYYRLLNA